MTLVWCDPLRRKWLTVTCLAPSDRRMPQSRNRFRNSPWSESPCFFGLGAFCNTATLVNCSVCCPSLRDSCLYLLYTCLRTCSSGSGRMGHASTCRGRGGGLGVLTCKSYSAWWPSWVTVGGCLMPAIMLQKYLWINKAPCCAEKLSFCCLGVARLTGC